MLGILRIGQYAKQTLVAGRAAAVFRRACPRATRANNDVATVRDHAFDHDTVLPIVAKVVVIQKLAADLGHGAERRGPLINDELRFLVVAHTKPNTAGIEIVQMAVLPPEGELNDFVQVR